MTHSFISGDKQAILDMCLVETGIGENFLALEGVELDIPVRTPSADQTTLWGDYFEEDIASLVKHAVLYQ